MPKPAIDVKKISPTEQALFAYLDEMLREGTESAAAIEVAAEAATATIPTATPAAIPAATPTDLSPALSSHDVVSQDVAFLDVAAQAVTEHVTAVETFSVMGEIAPIRGPATQLQDLAPRPVTPSETAADDTPIAGLPPTTPWQDNGRPLWAQSRFDALIFKVAGLKLAVPLVALGLIHPIDKKFNALPHQTDWFLGLLRVQGGSIKVIDTAMCVMPERYTPACREGLKYVITLHGYDWGLACHEVEKAICLEPDTINWRTQRGKRPWMAGTVRDHMCALIDSAGFHNVIAAVERDKHLPRP